MNMALHRTAPASAAVLLLLLACVSAYDNGLAAVPPMGWNTWCTDDICGASPGFAASPQCFTPRDRSPRPMLCARDQKRRRCDRGTRAGQARLSVCQHGRLLERDDARRRRAAAGEPKPPAQLNPRHSRLGATRMILGAAGRQSLSFGHEGACGLRTRQGPEDRALHVRRHSHMQVRTARKLRPLRARRPDASCMGH